MLEARTLIASRLLRDLVGPNWKSDSSEPDLNEKLDLGDSNPSLRYLCGYLEPRKTEMIEAKTIPELNDHDGESSPNSSEGEVSNSNNSIKDELLLSPSSLGLTFRCNNPSIKIKLNYGTYIRDEKGIWNRQHHEYTISHTVQIGNYDRLGDCGDGIRLNYRVSQEDGFYRITIRIVNDRLPPTNSDGSNVKSGKALATIFQPNMIITCNGGTFFETRKDLISDPQMYILYRNSTILALGHNVGVNWDEDQTSIWIEHLPSHYVPEMLSNENLNQYIPEMNKLENIEYLDESLDKLQQLVGAYSSWIKSCENTLNSDFGTEINQTIIDEISKQISSGRSIVNRMSSGIQTLRSNSDARIAFCHANKAIKYSQEAPKTTPLGNNEFKWRPFQIAFQLLNLNGLLALNKEDEFYEERDILDLAWFPTGGGKTEAYLGLISLIGFYRRLKVPESEKHPSVHAIMRYTLRLLTMDQGERLVRLMGGMNEIACNSSSKLIQSGQRFRVGMWIGKKSSPNLLKGDRKKNDATNILLNMKSGSIQHSSRVIMFESCPWCGDSSVKDPSQWEIGLLNNRDSLIGKCAEVNCIFSTKEGIPFTCIDEDIYNNPPSVLLGTADKFVQAAYNRSYGNSKDEFGPLDVRRLLGFSDENHVRPPDLIIQDELHLLTGPLGSMAGLLETALDAAWMVAHSHRPKYIAATATIRGAKRDAKLMFGRDLSIFPPPINTAKDNFFASESNEPQRNGRLHMAVLGPPFKSRTIGDLPIASLLQSGQAIRKKFGDEISDPYWTLVAYYNSLRELGGLQSSLSSRIKNEWIPEYSDLEGDRELEHTKELTSRVTQSRLVEAKKSLERSLSDGSTVDLVATSNMFQVGIDISRLGLMAINGQPKSNSEYIQSSGRVGRKYPGLVLTLLRSTYPRDQSHYEMHRSFHQELYRHVDQTSTTPFSLRALDRSLDTTLMALIRLVSPELSNNTSLNLLVNGDRRRVRKPIQDAVKFFIASIESRLEKTQFKAINDQSYIKNVVEQIDLNWRNLQEWVKLNSQTQTCCWTEPHAGKSKIINPLWWAKSTDGDGGEAPIISSLRDVADEVPVGLRIGNLNGDLPKWSNYKMPAGHILSHASPGSIWEKDGLSYLTGGLSQWQNKIESPNPPLTLHIDQGGCLVRERQIDSQYGLLGPHVNKLRVPPTKKEHGFVTATIFPQSFTCSKGHISSGKLLNDLWQCGMNDCNKKVVQNRFVSICPDGHLHNFNYSWWVHQKPNKMCAVPKIRLNKLSGHAYDLGRWQLTCESCNAKANMKKVTFASSDDNYGTMCNKYGEPWLRNEWNGMRTCTKFVEHRQIGAASVTYNRDSSLLLIPLAVSWDLANNEAVSDFVGEGMSLSEMKEWYDVKKAKGKHKKFDLMLKNTMFDKGNEDLDTDSFFKLLFEYDNLHINEPLDLRTIRKKERGGLSSGNSHNLDSRFSCTKIEFNRFGEKEHINSDWPLLTMSRVDRLTELRYVTGLARIHDSNPELPIDQSEDGNETLGLASYNFGEGIYFEINIDWLNCKVSKRKDTLGDLSSMPYSFEPGRMPVKIIKQIPSLEKSSNVNGFTILHSLSHLLMKQLCEMSGYSLGSIRERLYYHSDDGDIETAGILIYTSGPSSDGTLGGLSGQANQKRINLMIKQALTSLDMCSNDPVCSEHRSLNTEPNGAACHTCLILPETSCECRNHLLDRNWG